MRPVALYVTALAYENCKKRNELLPKYINVNPVYSTKSFLQLFNNIKNLHLLLNIKLASFDVNN